MQISDRGLIIPAFPTTSLLCAVPSIIDDHLNHIRISVRKPYDLCKRPAGICSKHRIQHSGSRIWLTLDHCPGPSRSIINIR